MKIYTEGTDPLHEILKSAAQDATLLVPDLQRPYVWTPNQVILLVDSLLRGWPFGTLLLWSVRNDELAGIPSRPFWRIADRTRESDDQQVGKSNPPAQFRMVLDGQQRLQSLLIAFGGDAWGFRLLDQEWSTVLDAERPRGRNAKQHWSLGHLCLDVDSFGKRLKAAGGDIENIDFRDVLSWVVQDPNHGRSALPKPANYKFPIPSSIDLESKGRFIRLSRLWDMAPIQQKPAEKHFRLQLKPLLNNHEVPEDVIVEVLDSLAELMTKIVDIKQATVSYLQLLPFDADVGGSQDVYNDAIVNIFTRLNTAGRALTRQEITFAWIKNGWGDGSKTGNRTAGRCFEDLQSSLSDAGVNIDIDGLVGTVSAMWSVLHREGTLLTANDLLRGEKVRPMANDLVNNWDTLTKNAIECAHLVHDRGLIFLTHYRSLNVLTLLMTWRLLGRLWLATHPLTVTAKDGFEKSLDEVFNSICDRWILMSQWSGRWGKSTDKTFAEYVKDLSNDWVDISKQTSPQDVINVLHQRMKDWISALQTESMRHIDDMAVLERNRVHDYYLPLWLWHRLDAQRWKASTLQLRESKRGSVSLEVDHVVAVKLSERLQNSCVQVCAEDEAEIADDDLTTTMNAFGNCCLLEKSFNIAKRAESLEAFLRRVHEFQSGTHTVDAWTADLGIDPVLVNPEISTINNIIAAVKTRTITMKTEIKEYLAGDRQRRDI